MTNEEWDAEIIEALRGSTWTVEAPVIYKGIGFGHGRNPVSKQSRSLQFSLQAFPTAEMRHAEIRRQLNWFPDEALSYEISGRVVTLRERLAPTPAERVALFNRILIDTLTPEQAFLLLDYRYLESALTPEEIADRLRLIRHHLGTRVGPVAAVLAPEKLLNAFPLFAKAAELAEIQLNVFTQELPARAWLQTLHAGPEDPAAAP